MTDDAGRLANETTSGAPSVAFRWIVLAVAVATQGVANCYLLGLASVSPELKSQFGLSIGQVGLMLAAPVFGLATTTLFWGIACDRFDESRLLALGLGGATIALFAASKCTHATELFAVLFVAGATGAVANTATSRTIIAWFPMRERGMALGVRHMSAPAGVLVAGLVFPHIVGNGVSTVFVVLSIAVFVVGLVTFLVLHNSKALNVPMARQRGGTMDALRNRGLLRLSAGASLSMACQASLVSFFVLLLTSNYGLSLAAAALCLSVTQGLAAFGRIAVGWASDRMGARVPILRFLAAGAGILTILAAFLLGVSLVIELPILVIASCLASIPNGLTFARAVEIVGTARSGTSIGLLNTITTGAGALGSSFFGGLVSRAGWNTALIAVGVLSLISWVVYRPIDERRMERAAQAA